VARRQFEQWQFSAYENSSLTSYWTLPHRQLPVSVRLAFVVDDVFKTPNSKWTARFNIPITTRASLLHSGDRGSPQRFIYQCLMKGNLRCCVRRLGQHGHLAALLRNPVEAAEPRSARREWPFAEGTGRGIAPSARSAQGRAVSAPPRTRAGGDASEIECSSFDFRQARNPWGEFLSVLSLLVQGKYPARRCGNQHQLRRRSRSKPVFRLEPVLAKARAGMTIVWANARVSV